MNRLAEDANLNIQLIKDMTGNSPDIIIKKIELAKNKDIYIVYCQSVAESDKINDFILKSISADIKNNKKFIVSNIIDTFNNTIPNVNLITINNLDDLFYYLFNGFCLIIMDKQFEAIAIETKANIDRGITEANIEPVIYGPKDSFTENFYKNVGLIRKRIKDKSLWLEEKIVGKKTKSKVGILYIEDIVEKKLVKIIKKKLDTIDVDGIFDIEQIKQLIYKGNSAAFPVFLHTERPDLTSMCLLEGKVALMVENSPSVIIIPTFLMDFMHGVDDVYQKPDHVTFTRLIKIICFIITVITPGYFVATLAYNQEVIPTPLLISIIGQRSNIPFPAFIEAFMLAITFEIIKESDIRHPVNIGGSISILGALVLGQAAVTAGIVSAFMLIIIAITSIAGLVFQSIEITNALRYWRFAFLIFGSFFGLIGIVIGGLYLITQLSSLKSFGRPYLYPIAPLNTQNLKDAIIKLSAHKSFKRNEILTDNNIIKQRRS